MGKGRFIKSAERACAAKARFATVEEAERTSEYRFGAYACPVCHQFHLTSQAPARTRAERPPTAEPDSSAERPRLGDLNWSAAYGPPPPKRLPGISEPPKPPLPPARIRAECASALGADGKVRLILAGRLVKSRKVASAALRKVLGPGVWVFVSTASGTPEVEGLAT